MPAPDAEFNDLIVRLNGGDGVTPLTDEELSGLRDRVSTILGEVDRSNPSDTDLQVATEGASVIRAVDAEIAKRSNVEARRAEAIARIVDGALGDGPAVVVPVAASGLPRISQLASRTPRRSRPVSRHNGPELLTASGAPIGNVTPSEYIRQALKRELGRDRADGKVVLATMRAEFPPERTLNENPQGNALRLTAAEQADTALLASGGICAPVASDYSVSAIATADRPVRSGLTQFGASRGGIRFVAPHSLAAVHADAPNSVWLQSTDAAPGGQTKGYTTYTCQSVQEVYVDAIVQQVKFGNFQQRYFPEQLDEYLTTADGDHARLAESTALATMVSSSTSINAGNNGTGQTGWASEYLAELDRIIAGYRYRHRMPMDSPLQLFYPEWSEDAMRADLARELPGNSGGQSERLAVADAQIDRFFATRNLAVTKFLDSPTGYTPVQGWVAQGAGDALPWPTKVLSLLFHPGAFIFLDGGELNLGIIRDSTLNATNNVMFFKESFERVVYRGHESLAITMDLSPDGARAATVDTTSLSVSGS